MRSDRKVGHPDDAAWSLTRFFGSLTHIEKIGTKNGARHNIGVLELGITEAVGAGRDNSCNVSGNISRKTMRRSSGQGSRSLLKIRFRLEANRRRTLHIAAQLPVDIQ